MRFPSVPTRMWIMMVFPIIFTLTVMGMHVTTFWRQDLRMKNNDGILADLPTTVDINGQVTSTNRVDGYTTPADADSIGTADYLESGAVPAITSQPTNVTVFDGSGTTFTVIANDANNYQYSVIVSNSAYSCASPLTSDAATLFIRVRTVISNRRITHRVKKD